MTWRSLGWLWGVILIVVAAAVVVVVRKAPWEPTDESRRAYMAQEVAERRAETVPASASGLVVTVTTWDRHCAKTSWEFQTDQPWAEYAAWVEGQLRGGFTVNANDAGATAKRRVAGDAHEVHIERVSSGPPLRVRVVFRSCAD